MRRQSLIARSRGATRKAWLGAALVAVLLLAESFAVTHPFDRAAHTDGQPCAVCLSVADLGAGAIGAPPTFELGVAAPLLVVSINPALLSSAPVRRYARGPPAVSFAS